MNPAATPSNGATTLGSREDCIVVSAGDTFDIDVTIEGIPSGIGMIAYAASLNYPDGVITVTAANSDFLLTANPGSVLFAVNDPVPDAVSPYTSAALDIGLEAHETGDGVLVRLTLAVDGSAPTGQYSLTLTDVAHTDPTTIPHLPLVVNNAIVAIDMSCGPATPTTTPTP
jgi:hypothetical protein